MDYGAIIKKSWFYLWRYRNLWWLGILAALGESGGGYTRLFQSDSSSLFDKLPSNTSPQNSGQKVLQTMNNFPKVLGAENYSDAWSRAVTLIMDNWQIALAILLALLALCFLIAYIASVAKAGLILAIDGLEKGLEPQNFKPAFQSGLPYAWKLIGLKILVGLLVVSILVVFAVIAAVGFSSNQTVGIVLGLVSTVIGLIFLVVASVYLSLTFQIAQRYLVLENVGVLQSFDNARNLLRQKLWPSLLTYLVGVGMSALYGLVLSIAIALPAIIMIGLAIAFGDSASNSAVAWAIAFISLLFLLMLASLFLAGLYCVFETSYWNISYRALNYLANQPKTSND